MHPFENLPISSQAASFSSALSLHNKADERARYLEFSVMKIRTFLEYLSDRIRTVSFSHVLMVNGSKDAVRCIYARTAS